MSEYIDASAALQAAIILKLRQSTLSDDLMGRIYDRLPQAMTFPYLIVVHMASTDDSSVTSFGQIHKIALRIWSRYCGHLQVKSLISKAIAILHKCDLDLGSDISCISCQVVATSINDENDGVTTCGILNLRVVTENIN